LLESYRRQHNEQKHYFSVDGKTSAWVPKEKFDAGLARYERLSFSAQDVRHFAKYGYDKIKATVGAKGTVTFNNHSYQVAVGAQNFSRHKSTKVHVSDLGDKLLIFEHKENGILLGEALRRVPYDKPVKRQPGVEPIYVATRGDMRKFKEICTDCRDKAKELGHSFVDLNLVVDFLANLHPM
jgi:phosphotransferase system IIB component